MHRQEERFTSRGSPLVLKSPIAISMLSRVSPRNSSPSVLRTMLRAPLVPISHETAVCSTCPFPSSPWWIISADTFWWLCEVTELRYELYCGSQLLEMGAKYTLLVILSNKNCVSLHQVRHNLGLVVLVTYMWKPSRRLADRQHRKWRDIKDFKAIQRVIFSSRNYWFSLTNEGAYKYSSATLSKSRADFFVDYPHWDTIFPQWKRKNKSSGSSAALVILTYYWVQRTMIWIDYVLTTKTTMAEASTIPIPQLCVMQIISEQWICAFPILYILKPVFPCVSTRMPIICMFDQTKFSGFELALLGKEMQIGIWVESWTALDTKLSQVCRLLPCRRVSSLGARLEPDWTRLTRTHTPRIVLKIHRAGYHRHRSSGIIPFRCDDSVNVSLPNSHRAEEYSTDCPLVDDSVWLLRSSKCMA